MAGASSDASVAGLIVRLIGALLLSAFVSHKLVPFIAKVNPEDLNILSEPMATGKVVPVIDRRYSLNEAPEALRYSEKGHARGKVVINDGRKRQSLTTRRNETQVVSSDRSHRFASAEESTSSSREAGAFPPPVTVPNWMSLGDFPVSLLVTLGLSISGDLRHRVASRIFHIPMKWHGLASSGNFGHTARNGLEGRNKRTDKPVRASPIVLSRARATEPRSESPALHRFWFRTHAN